MSLKEKVDNYFKTSKRKRRKHYFIMLEDFWKELEYEVNRLDIPVNWNLDRKIWHYTRGILTTPKCKSCNFNDSKWQIYKHDYGFCSQSCANRESLIKISESLGVSNRFQLETIKEKSKNTLMVKYGVDNISKLESIKLQKSITTIKNHGRPHNVGDNSILMMKKYNVKSPSHIPEVFEKIQYNRFKKRHKFITPSGITINLQGFEPQVYKILLEEGYYESEIIYKKSEMPKIFYFLGNKKKRYYPDFFIKDKNIIIEVKSKYTYEIELEKNELKERASKEMGLNYRLIIYEK